jgi:hypothetical protein
MKKITEEELEEIKRVNREKLDEILGKGPEYIIELAIKYYGESWMTVFSGEETYLHYERTKHNQRFGSVRTVKGNRERPIHKLDINTKEIIKSYDTVLEAAEEMGFNKVQTQSLIGALTGRYEHYMGYSWKFADVDKVVIYGEDSY